MTTTNETKVEATDETVQEVGDRLKESLFELGALEAQMVSLAQWLDGASADELFPLVPGARRGQEPPTLLVLMKASAILEAKRAEILAKMHEIDTLHATLEDTVRRLLQVGATDRVDDAGGEAADVGARVVPRG